MNLLTIECLRCGDPVKVVDEKFKEAMERGKGFYCTDCQVFLRSAAELDISRGKNVELPEMPTIQGKFRHVQHYQQMEEQPNGSHRCPCCGTTLWRAIFMTRGTIEVVPIESESSDVKSEVVPRGAQLILDECPNPDCDFGWGAVRNWKKYDAGDNDAPMPRRELPKEYLPAMAPPWSGSEEKHQEFWRNINQKTQAGKGPSTMGLFGEIGLEPSRIIITGSGSQQ